MGKSTTNTKSTKETLRNLGIFGGLALGGYFAYQNNIFNIRSMIEGLGGLPTQTGGSSTPTPIQQNPTTIGHLPTAPPSPQPTTFGHLLTANLPAPPPIQHIPPPSTTTFGHLPAAATPPPTYYAPIQQQQQQPPPPVPIQQNPTTVSNPPPPAPVTGGVRNDSNYTVGAFFYPWYGKWTHWVDGGHTPPKTWGANFLPQLFPEADVATNLYDDNDPKVIQRQMYLMNSIGIQFGIASWWGIGTFEDKCFDTIINVVHPKIGYANFKWCCLYEDEGFETPPVSQLVNDLNHIKQKFTRSPFYLHVNGKPVIFVYNAAHAGYNPMDDLNRWKQAKAQTGFYVVLKRDPLTAGANPADMDGWYEYAPADAHFAQLGSYSAFISPGFHLYHNAVRLPPATPTQWEAAVSKLAKAPVRWKTIQTWNEWGEGTGIEPAVPIIHDDAAGFKIKPTNILPSQQYHEIFKKYFR